MGSIVNNIIAYEAGELTEREALEFFGELVKTGTAWQLQGSYGRTAAALIEAGYLSPEGEILAIPEAD